MVVVYFGITVSEITEEESRKLIDELVDEGIIDIGNQDWEIVELGYDGQTYFVDHLNSDDRSNFIFHAISDQSHDSGWLTIKFNWYNSSAKTRDRVSYKSRFDDFIKVLSNLSSLSEEVKKHTDKQVAVGAIEER